VALAMSSASVVIIQRCRTANLLVSERLRQSIPPPARRQEFVQK